MNTITLLRVGIAGLGRPKAKRAFASRTMAHGHETRTEIITTTW
jgi:hypothetical protein